MQDFDEDVPNVWCAETLYNGTSDYLDRLWIGMDDDSIKIQFKDGNVVVTDYCPYSDNEPIVMDAAVFMYKFKNFLEIMR